MESTLKTIALSGCDFKIIATREGMEAEGLEVITRYDEDFETHVLAGYYIVKGDFAYYCPGAFPLASKVVEVY